MKTVETKYFVHNLGRAAETSYCGKCGGQGVTAEQLAQSVALTRAAASVTHTKGTRDEHVGNRPDYITLSGIKSRCAASHIELSHADAAQMSTTDATKTQRRLLLGVVRAVTSHPRVRVPHTKQTNKVDIQTIVASLDDMAWCNEESTPKTVPPSNTSPASTSGTKVGEHLRKHANRPEHTAVSGRRISPAVRTGCAVAAPEFGSVVPSE